MSRKGKVNMQQDEYKVTFEHTRTLSKACTHVQSSFTFIMTGNILGECQPYNLM